MEKIRIYHGDCIEVLKDFESNSIDSIVTDPPYGISFMGKHWDYDVPGVEVWRECLRVLKPGGHILVACGTRTQHRMAVNIEDAGFEIRDLIAWVYGSGFPKSLNVGKQVDKVMGNEREVIGDKPYTTQDIRGNAFESEIARNRPRLQEQITKGNSEFEGWGTAIKPAMELWTLARKPLIGTVAENVLEWKTGGLNIDGCRVDTISGNDKNNFHQNRKVIKEYKADDTLYELGMKTVSTSENPNGRFPANFIHDGSEEVVGLFPETKSGKLKKDCYKNKRDNSSMFAGGGIFGHSGYEADSGSASRFFYCAKASKRERDAGLDGFDDRLKLTQMRSANGTGEKNFDGGFNDQIMKNNHPTVKPIALMRYLCRLITPKGGTVLDPFTGSGSTGCGAVHEGFNFIGIEREPEYVEIAKARIEYCENQSIEEVFTKFPEQMKLF